MTTTLITRRGLLRGLVAAPAVVAFQSIMPVRSLAPMLSEAALDDMLVTIYGFDAWGKIVREQVRMSARSFRVAWPTMAPHVGGGPTALISMEHPRGD